MPERNWKSKFLAYSFFLYLYHYFLMDEVQLSLMLLNRKGIECFQDLALVLLLQFNVLSHRDSHHHLNLLPPFIPFYPPLNLYHESMQAAASSHLSFFLLCYFSSHLDHIQLAISQAIVPLLLLLQCGLSFQSLFCQ